MAPARTAVNIRVRTIMSSSHCKDLGLLDDVAHEAAGIPVGRIGLGLASGAGASDHQCVTAPGRPAPPAVAGKLDARYAGIAAERDAAHDGRGSGRQPIAGLDVGDEGTR